MKILRLVLAGALPAIVLAAGCRRQAPPAPSPAVARFEGGSVTAEEIDRAVLDLPPHQRQPADGDLLAWYERIARELAVHEVLLAEARQAGLDRGAGFERAREEARTQATVAVFLEKTLPAAAEPTENEIRAYFEAHRGDFRTPPSRETLHLFRRIGPGAKAADAAAEVARLRARVLAGEDFATLAAQHSESESRHQKGLLGWVTPGRYSPDLDRVIFSLERGVPSRPLRTAEGVHLFLVRAESPARNYTLAEVRTTIARRLVTEAREAAIARLVGSETPEGSFVPDAAELQALFEAGDQAAVVLQVGDLKVTLAELQRRLLSGQAPPNPSDSPAHTLVLAMKQRYLIYRYCVGQGLDRGPEVEARLQRILDQELARQRLRERLLARVDRDPRRLRDYYEANKRRFSTPLRLRVQRLVVPLGPSANAVMARLEAARAELDRGREEFARLAAAVSGTLEEPVWQTAAQLATREGRAVSQTAGLAAGRHSPPLRLGGRIEMARVLERTEPEPLPFEQVRDVARADLIMNRQAEEHAALVGEMLEERRYEVSRGELEALLRRETAGR